MQQLDAASTLPIAATLATAVLLPRETAILDGLFGTMGFTPLGPPFRVVRH